MLLPRPSSGSSKHLPDDGQVRVAVAEEATAGRASEVARTQDHELEPVRRDFDEAPLVVDLALPTPVYAAHCQPVRFVEVCDGLIVLALVHLDHEPQVRPVRIHR